MAYGAPVTCPRYVPGEVITSVVQGTNADLLCQVAKLWICPEDRLIDVTAGNGTFWARTDVQPVRSDIRLLPGIDLIADCRKLPYPNASMDVVVFDPPYQPVHGQPERSFGVGRSYGLTEGPVVLQTINDVPGLYEAGIAECTWVLVPRHRPAAGQVPGHDLQPPAAPGEPGCAPPDDRGEWVTRDRTWAHNAARYRDAYARLGQLR